jgi:hypothetical protein
MGVEPVVSTPMPMTWAGRKDGSALRASERVFLTVASMPFR